MKKEIQIKTAYGQRNKYMEKQIRIDGKSYEVVSVFSEEHKKCPSQTVMDKLRYLISESAN